MIREPNSGDNLHSVHSTRQPLGIECMQCQRRAALDHDKIDAYSGNMKSVRTLRFKCTVCGSVANRLYLFHNRGEVDDFLAGKAEWSCPSAKHHSRAALLDKCFTDIEKLEAKR